LEEQNRVDLLRGRVLDESLEPLGNKVRKGLKETSSNSRMRKKIRDPSVDSKMVFSEDLGFCIPTWRNPSRRHGYKWGLLKVRKGNTKGAW
jgi:hypothetical protein